jgi:hypothetical protein
MKEVGFPFGFTMMTKHAYVEGKLFIVLPWFTPRLQGDVYVV